MRFDFVFAVGRRGNVEVRQRDDGDYPTARSDLAASLVRAFPQGSDARDLDVLGLRVARVSHQLCHRVPWSTWR